MRGTGRGHCVGWESPVSGGVFPHVLALGSWASHGESLRLSSLPRMLVMPLPPSQSCQSHGDTCSWKDFLRGRMESATQQWRECHCSCDWACTYIVYSLVYGAPSLSFWKWARGHVLFCSSGVNARVLAIFLVLTGVSELHIIAISLKVLLMNRPFCAGLAWINVWSLLFLICLTPDVQWL